MENRMAMEQEEKYERRRQFGYLTFFLCFVNRASRYTRVKKSQTDAQLILIIFRHLLHVSGVSRLIIRRYNHMYTTIGTYSF
jgi:hypothetical protein